MNSKLHAYIFDRKFLSTVNLGSYLIILVVFIFGFKNIYGQCYSNFMSLSSFFICPAGQYTLVLTDDFNGAELDDNIWDDPEIGVPRDLYFETQKAWHLPQNVYTQNGGLVIVSKKEDNYNMPVYRPTGTVFENFKYSSGEVWTRRKFGFGKFEARVKIPNGKGLFPAFWLFNAPPWNEIDIFEFKNVYDGLGIYWPNRHSKKHRMTVHHDFDNDGNDNMCTFDNENQTDYSSGFFDFGLIWQPDRIEWMINGSTVYTHYRFIWNGAAVGCYINGQTVYQKANVFPMDPMKIIFNVAIQYGFHNNNSNKPNEPDNTVQFPKQMEVKWFKFYKLVSCSDITVTDFSQQPLISDNFNFIVGNNVIIDCNYPVTNNSYLKILGTESIRLKPGFHVEDGSYLNALIDPNVCGTYKTDMKTSQSSNTYEMSIDVNNINTQYRIGYLASNPV